MCQTGLNNYNVLCWPVWCHQQCRLWLLSYHSVHVFVCIRLEDADSDFPSLFQLIFYWGCVAVQVITYCKFTSEYMCMYINTTNKKHVFSNTHCLLFCLTYFATMPLWLAKTRNVCQRLLCYVSYAVHVLTLHVL